jgi:hypothetical protein
MVWLDAAVVVGGLLVLTKVSDLLLRPRQQQRLQVLVETATLRLSYASVIGGARRLAGRHFGWLVARLVRLFPLHINKSTTAIGPMLQSRSGMTAELAGLVIVVIVAAEAVATVPAALALRWILHDGNGRRTALRFAALLIVLVLATQAAEYVLITDPRAGSRLLDRALGGVILVASAVASALFITAWVIVLALVAHVVLRVVEAVAWRVVEYQKGAWAAVVAIATAILGLVDLYLK